MDIEQSKKRIEYLLGMTYEEAIEEVERMITNELADADVNVNITGIEFTGSQRFGNPRDDSDLDVVFTYENIDERWKEDTLFNILNEEPMYLCGCELDINPIEDGDIEYYINKASQYKKESLTEDTRNQLTAASRNAGLYKGDKTRGKNRFERKKWSKVASQVKSYNQIDMNDFFKKDQLDIKIPVTGETNSYTMTLRLNGVCAEIAKNIKNNKNIFEFKTVIQALTKVFNTTNIFVNCTCDDYKFRFNHWSVVNNIGTTDSAHDPGPGKGIANPLDDKGKGCKHVLICLANQDWLMKVCSVITNYVNYIAENRQAAFNKIIFPKLYGISVEDAKENGLVPEETNLETDKNLIDTINEFAKNKGKFKAGTNKNPVAGSGKIDLEKKVQANQPTTTTAKPAEQKTAEKPEEETK